MNFHENLRNYRLKMGYTQSEMAYHLGMSERGYRYYENGQREPNLSTLVIIADLLEVSIDDLVGRSLSKDSLVDSE